MTLPETPTRTALRAEVDAAFASVDTRLDDIEGGGAPVGPHTHPTSDITGFNAAVDARAQTKIDALVAGAPGVLDTLNEIAQALGDDPNAVATLTTAIAGKQAAHANLTGVSGVGTVDEMIVFRYGGAWIRRTLAEFVAMLGITGGGASAPLFNIETYGAVADDTTDCYPAVLAAWNAMLAFSKGGRLFAPTIGVYRVVLNTSRVVAGPDAQYCAFPLPMRPRGSGTTKPAYGIQGVGEAYVVRTAELGGTPGQVNTSSVLRFDYNPADFAWSPSLGLPSVFGCDDADMTDPEGNTFSNIHFCADDMIFRSPVNPSVCVLNLEQVSTCRLGRVRFDVNAVLDLIPEPTRPTGAAYLLPRSNNNVAIEIDAVEVEGYYAGIAMTEHARQNTGIALRCKVGAFTRRLCSHASKIGQLKLEQCQFGFAGYNPAGVGPNLGVIAFQGWIGVIGMVDIEHYAYNGDVPWIYTPVYGSDVYDPLNRFNGNIAAWTRINSEPQTPPGIGIGTGGQSSSLYVRGASGVNSPIAVWTINNHTTPATRVLGTAPSNPPVAPPNAPTIGAATAGVESAQVAFTPAGAGEPADDYTATAYNGSNVAVGTADGASSPITVTGLTAGVQVTLKVKANNVIGSSAESAASNAVTPTAPAGLPSDDFNGPDAGTLGTSSSGHAWLGDPLGTWERIGNQAEANTTGTAWNPAWILVGQNDYRVVAETVHRAGEWGLCARVVDDQNFYYLDYQYDSASSGIVTLYKRVAGSLTQMASETIAGLTEGVTMRLQLQVNGDVITAFANRAIDPDNTIGAPVTDSSFASGGGAGIVSLVTTTPHVTLDNFAVVAVTP